MSTNNTNLKNLRYFFCFITLFCLELNAAKNHDYLNTKLNKLPNDEAKMNYLFTIAKDCNQHQDTTNAYYFGLRAIDFAIKINSNHWKGMAHINLAKLYMSNKYYEKALFYSTQAIDISKLIQEDGIEIQGLLMNGEIKLKLGDSFFECLKPLLVAQTLAMKKKMRNTFRKLI